MSAEKGSFCHNKDTGFRPAKRVYEGGSMSSNRDMYELPNDVPNNVFEVFNDPQVKFDTKVYIGGTTSSNMSPFYPTESQDM